MKLAYPPDLPPAPTVALFTSAWIETEKLIGLDDGYVVALFTSAWIETLTLRQKTILNYSVISLKKSVSIMSKKFVRASGKVKKSLI